MSLRHTPEESHQAVMHTREMRLVKCPYCKHELPEGVDVAVWPNPPWVTVCAKCPFCDVGLSFFVMPAIQQAQPENQQPS